MTFASGDDLPSQADYKAHDDARSNDPTNAAVATTAAIDADVTDEFEFVCRIPVEQFAEGVRPSDHPFLPPVVWGALAVYLAPPLRQTTWTVTWKWITLWVGLIVLVHELPRVVTTTHGHFHAAAVLYFVLWCLFDYLCWTWARRKASETLSRDVNPILRALGYEAVYRHDKVSFALPTMHSVDVYTTTASRSPVNAHRQPLPQTRTSDMLHRLLGVVERNETFTQISAVVYLHATPLQHIFSWGCNLCRPAFITDPFAVAAPKGLHPAVWGALQQSFRVPELEKLRRQFTFYLILWVVITSFFTIDTIWSDDAGSWWFRILFMSPLLLLLCWLAECRWMHTARTIGHSKWTHAMNEWQDVLPQIGWHVQYNHDDLAPTWCASPSFFVILTPYSSDYLQQED